MEELMANKQIMAKTIKYTIYSVYKNR